MEIKKIEFYKVNAHITYNNGLKCIIPKKNMNISVFDDSIFDQILKQRKPRK